MPHGPDSAQYYLTILLVNGNRRFAQTSTPPINNIGGPTFAIVGDFNGDAKPDIVAGTQLGYVTIHLNNRDGTFTLSSTLALPA